MKKNSSFMLAIASTVLINLAFSIPAWAAEYQRPPFELMGRLTVSDEFRESKDIAYAMFENSWSGLKIIVYKDYFSGYYRWVSPKDDNHIVLLAISGAYERGYLVGSWEYSNVNQWDDTNHGPYPQVYEASGTFVSGLIESKTTESIPAKVMGTIKYTHGDLDPKGEPGKAIWIQEESSLTFNSRWEGKIQGDVCGGPDLDEYVGKAIETGKIVRDYSGKAQIMHCGLADGSSAIKWENVKDNELVYVSDLLYYSSNGTTIFETYHPDDLKERKADSRWGMLPGEQGVPPQAAGYTYVVGGTLQASGENPGSGVISFLYPPPRETKLGLVMGRMWAQTKAAIIDGRYLIETSQAVAGIKGTNFILGSHDPRITELMVLEGAVEFTAKADGKTVMVNAGQKAVATEMGMGEPESFDPAPLLAAFTAAAETPPPVEEEDYTAGPALEGAPDGPEVSATAERSRKSSSDDKGGINYAIWIAIIAAVVGGGWAVKRRKGVKVS